MAGKQKGRDRVRRSRKSHVDAEASQAGPAAEDAPQAGGYVYKEHSGVDALRYIADLPCVLPFEARAALLWAADEIDAANGAGR